MKNLCEIKNYDILERKIPKEANCLYDFFEEKFSECLDWFKKMGMPDYRSFILATYSGKIITSTNFLKETIVIANKMVSQLNKIKISAGTKLEPMT